MTLSNSFLKNFRDTIGDNNFSDITRDCKSSYEVGLRVVESCVKDLNMDFIESFSNMFQDSIEVDDHALAEIKEYLEIY